MSTKFIFASLSVGLIATTATSADLGSVDAPRPLPPQGAVADIIHDWSGGYVGVVGGGAVGEVETQTGSGTLFSETPLRGGLVGVAAGYNVQSGNMVYGVEADVSWAKVQGDKACAGFPSQTCRYELGWQGTARARVGVAMDRTLFYVTGGLAVAEGNGGVDPIVGAIEGEDQQTYFGYVAGVGAEYAMTDALSFKAEYLYTDYAKRTSPLGTVSPLDSYESDPSSHLIRVGVNYRF
ncbi:MAG: porin family protein [Alphaproteobacteria bacterium]|nr:porin family protein [Alphaproteobacteria bacterium]